VNSGDRSEHADDAPPRDVAALVSDALVRESVVYAFAHGISMAVEGRGTDAPGYTHAPFSLFPTPIGRDAWDEALALGPVYARLVDRVAHDRSWLEQVLADVRGTDAFTTRLCDVWSAAGHAQPMMLGILRSDYMVDATTRHLLQVELNTIASSFGSLSSRISEMHAYLSGRYGLPCNELPANPAIVEIAAAIAHAHRLFCAGFELDHARPVVVFIVQKGERNAFDQLYLEYELFQAHGIRVERRSLDHFDVDAPLDPKGHLRVGDRPTSVVYFRAGYTPRDYPGEAEWRGRLTVERSTAIKCPSITYHLVGAKKVQQSLAVPGELERFVDDDDARARLRRSFAGLWALTPETRDVQRDAIGHPERYVMKPQREGGGNNLYGEALKTALETLSEREKGAYILMSRIFPRTIENALIRDGEARVGPTIAEVGIFTTFIADGPPQQRTTRRNAGAGHIMRTKFLGVDEGGVASGFSCLSSPDVIDEGRSSTTNESS